MVAAGGEGISGGPVPPGDVRKHVDLRARLALHGVNCAAEHAASRENMMSVQPLRREHDRNPCTVEEAEALVKHVESLFMPWNIDALVGGFTDDCVVRFGTVPEFRGREALRAFFTARSGKQRGYRLKKSFRTLMNDTITNAWEGEWQDAESGTTIAALASKSGSCATARSRPGRRRSTPGALTRRTASSTFCADLIGARLALQSAYPDRARSVVCRNAISVRPAGPYILPLLHR
jgi:nuclear transport factor 2 (NTF2) superfamily protein